MTELDAAGRVPGYYDSPFPGEDGGPRRQLAPRSAGLGIGDGERLEVAARTMPFANMVVLRAPGEVFVQGNTQPWEGTTSWVERIDPVTLATLARSPDLPGGPFWAGGILAHENGYLYVTYGSWCHKLDDACQLVASRELPRARPYNSLLSVSDGCLVMKDFIRDGSRPGGQAARSRFIVLEPEQLEPVGPEVEVPEPSIARISCDISADGEFVYVVGDHTIFRYRYERGELARDDGWSFRYRTLPDGEQSYGWDPVIAGGSAWFMDNGQNDFRGRFRDTGASTGPLHLVRVSLADASDADVFTPFGLPRGTIVNPPLIDPARRIAVAYDSGNGRIAAFRYGGGPHPRPLSHKGRGETYERLWEHEMDASCHFLNFPDTGEIVVNDFREGGEHVVVMDIETGAEKARVATGSPVQSALFQSPGWSRDVYTCTFTTVSRAVVGSE
ncbi:MAG: hypothetical protein EPO22_14385 [Dehalococcoidia bacterium]|nr:MAG: hypothetical protein EPO22_14385 [Dehalococcoidia bacterium]